ncbi:MAG: hypothetical protein ABR592_12695 [Nitriliruptorales bacterium]
MAHPPSYHETGDESGGPSRRSSSGTPRWVKVFGIIALAVVLLFIILMLANGSGGRHGPGRHLPSRGFDNQVAPRNVQL